MSFCFVLVFVFHLLCVVVVPVLFQLSQFWIMTVAHILRNGLMIGDDKEACFFSLL